MIYIHFLIHFFTYHLLCIAKIFEFLLKVKNKKASAAGFEPARVTPVDFESTSLTTRTY